jgi:hypothetical protein
MISNKQLNLKAKYVRGTAEDACRQHETFSAKWVNTFQSTFTSTVSPCSVLKSGSPVPSHNCIQLFLHRLLDIRVHQHVQKGET